MHHKEVLKSIESANLFLSHKQHNSHCDRLTDKSLPQGLDSGNLHPAVVAAVSAQDPLQVSPHPEHRASQYVVVSPPQSHLTRLAWRRQLAPSLPAGTKYILT